MFHPLRIILSILGSAILAFGLCHVHAVTQITEGGILGLSLLIDRWLSVSPAYSCLVLNGICYVFGIRAMGKPFLLHSLISAGFYSLFYLLFEQIPPVFPFLTSKPLAAALIGALFVGIGVGFCVRAGGAPCGDDALAMTVRYYFNISIEKVYLISDITVLALSLTYIPVKQIVYSLITVVLSGQIIGLIQRLPISWKENENEF